jgi:hypothetical protein
MKNLKYHTVGKVLKSIRKILEKEAKSKPQNTQIHITSLYITLPPFPDVVQTFKYNVGMLSCRELYNIQHLIFMAQKLSFE